MSNSEMNLPPDEFQKAMNAAMPKYSGEKSVRDPGKLDGLIKPTDENNPKKPE